MTLAWYEPYWSFRLQSPRAKFARGKLTLIVWATTCLVAAFGLLGLWVAEKLAASFLEICVFAFGLAAVAFLLKAGSFWLIPPRIAVDERRGIGLKIGKSFQWQHWSNIEAVELVEQSNDRLMLNVTCRSAKLAIGVGSHIDVSRLRSILQQELGAGFTSQLVGRREVV